MNLPPRLLLLTGLSATIALAGCGGQLADDEPLTSIPIEVDEELVEPAPLRVEWTAPAFRTSGPDPVPEIPTRGPALDERHVYVVYGSRLRALAVSDGKLAWELELAEPIVAPPLVIDGGIALATDSGWLLADREGRPTGSVDLPGPPLDAVRIGARLLVVGAGVVTGIELPTAEPGTGNTARVVWTRSWEPAAALAPGPAGRQVVVSGAEQGVLALSISDGAVRWQRPEVPSAGVRPGVGPERAFVVGTDTRLRALRLSDGDIAWTSRQVGVRVRGAPAVVDDVVWVAGLDAGLHGYSASGGSHLFRLGLSGRSYLGLVRWGRWVVASPQYGPWALVRGPLQSLGPANPGSPRMLTIASGADLELLPATGPPGVATVDAEGRIRLLRPPPWARPL